MKNFVNPTLILLNRIFAATPNTLRPLRWWILGIFVAITTLCTWGAITQFKMDMSMESWFEKDDPFKIAYDQFKQDFGGDDGVFIVFQAKDGDVFSHDSIRLIHELTEELENPKTIEGLREDSDLDRIDRVTSITNSRYQIARGDDLLAAKMVTDKVPQTKQELADFKAMAMSQENFVGAFFSEDGEYGGFRIKTDFGVIPALSPQEALEAEEDEFGEEDDFELEVDSSIQVEKIKYQEEDFMNYVTFMEDLETVLNQQKYQDQFEFYPVGNPPMYAWAMDANKEAGILMIFMVLIIIGLLWSLLKSFSAVVWPIVIILAVSAWTVGGTALLGIEMSAMVSLTAMLIITVGVADSVHVMSTYLLYRREDLEHEEALTQTYRKTGIPIFITSLTTMGGMLALSFTGMPQFQVFGWMSAVGVLLAWFLTWTLLPACLDIWHPLKGVKGSEETRKIGMIGWFISAIWLQPLLNKIPTFVSKRPFGIAAIFLMIFAIFAYGSSIVKINTNLVELTEEGTKMRIAYDIVDEKMNGAQGMEVLLEFSSTDALKDPKVLQAMANLEVHLLKTYPEFVRKTFSLASMIKDTNRVMHEGKQEFYRVPGDAQLASQLMYLFSNANPEDRRALVNDNFSKSHITVQLNNSGSYEYREFFKAVNQDLERLFGPLAAENPGMKISLAGALPLIMELSQSMSESQMKSFMLAIVVISCIMILTLGSVQGGLISIIPNIIPALATFGAMGLLGVPLDGDTLVIAPVIIGLAVDDTIHLITHYRDSLLHGKDFETAIRETIKEVGQAVTFTSMILGFGFMVLSLSTYGGLSKMGVFGSLGIFIALFCDLFFLPALLYIFKPKMGTDGDYGLAHTATITTQEQP